MGRYQEGVWDADLREAERRRKPPTPLRYVLAPLVVLIVVVGVFAYLYSTNHLTFLNHGPGTPSYTLGLAGESSAYRDHVYIVNLTITAPSGLSTGVMGLRVLTPANATVPSGGAPGACDGGTPFYQCLAVSTNLTGWVVLLMSLGGDILAAYPSPAGSTAWNSNLVPFMDAGSLSILSPFPLTGSHDTLEAFGTGSSTVSGSATL